MTDVRLDAINLLTAIRDHDRNLDPFDRQDIDIVITDLEKSIKITPAREPEPCLQTGDILNWCIENQCGYYPAKCCGVTHPALCCMIGADAEKKKAQSEPESEPETGTILESNLKALHDGVMEINSRAIIETRNGHPVTICAECGREINISQAATCCETGLYYCDEDCMMLDLSERKAAGMGF
jgi:hypothetical protein